MKDHSEIKTIGVKLNIGKNCKINLRRILGIFLEQKYRKVQHQVLTSMWSNSNCHILLVGV
jgi:hypothetical protein